MNFRPDAPGVRGLLIANGVIYLLQGLLGVHFLVLFALLPYPDTLPWQLLSYGFLHGGLMHIAFNMYGVWIFGTPVEKVWGTQRFLIYYLVCVVGAAIVQLIVGAFTGSRAPTVGASGGVFGLLLAFAMMFPNQRLMLLFPPIPITALWFAIGYGLLSLWLGVTGSAAGVAHFAHLGGMLFGLLLILYWRSSAGRKGRLR
jgi:membrane associated rhomboid family serine protease